MKPETAGIVTPYLIMAAILGTGWLVYKQLKKK
jgi:hypothetical protein